MDYSGRVRRLSEALREKGFDAFFAHSANTVAYLTGCHEDPGKRFTTVAVSPQGELRAICPALSETQLRKTGIETIATWRDGEDPVPLFQSLAKDWSLDSGRLAVDTTLPAHMLLRMQAALPGADFQDGQPVLGPVMAQKGEDELAVMRHAAKIADDAFDAVRPRIRPGMTELDVERMLNEAMTVDGAVPYFAIIAAGPNGAEPHHLSDATVLQEGDVVVLDFGCDLQGYKSDITRTICLGRASDRAKEVYDAVYRAHMAGRKAIQAGATGESVDRAARQVIEDAGYGPQFFHRLGHGIGLNGHEDPFIVEGNRVPLAAGNCFSIEPGIYLEGEFGVRIENIVAATADGHESLNVDPSASLVEIG